MINQNNITMNETDPSLNKLEQNGKDENHMDISTIPNGVAHTKSQIVSTSTGSSTNLAISAASSILSFSKMDVDILRIVGQYLRCIGLNATFDQLAKESGVTLEDPASSKLRIHVLEGNWEAAEEYLIQLKDYFSISEGNVKKMKFLLLEQKYLEMLELGLLHKALDCLRSQVTPLHCNIEHVHKLSSYLMCPNADDLRKMANWSGQGLTSRSALLDNLLAFIPSAMTIPPHRLMTLLHQALEIQISHCNFHNVPTTSIPNTHLNIDALNGATACKDDEDTFVNGSNLVGDATEYDELFALSILKDHSCSRDDFPSTTAQTLRDHVDEVLICRFSPDGKMLATGSKDSFLNLYDVDEATLEVKLFRSLVGPSQGVAYLSWSPDSALIAACGSENTPHINIYNAKTGELKKKLDQPFDCLTYASWYPDGQHFVAGGIRGQFHLYNSQFDLQRTWEGVRVQGVACLADNRSVLAADAHMRIRCYDFENKLDSNCIQEDHSITSFTLSTDSRYALLNVSTQGVNLWDLRYKCLVKKFRGPVQNLYTIHSCFGGLNDQFVASGSEDGNVYIWHIRSETPLLVLGGHSSTVNCVHWNPKIPALFASCSDDGSVRIWKAKNSTGSNSNRMSFRFSEDDSSTASTLS